MTAVARYTANIGYTLTVDSTPPTGLFISSSTGQSGTTNYTKAGVVQRGERESPSPGDGPDGIYFLAMDRERRGAELPDRSPSRSRWKGP